MKFYSWLFGLMVCIGLQAQQPLFTNFQHFDSESGLPQNVISDIAQDEDGFMWFSTLDGLTRYDGKSFLLFQNNSKSINQIRSNSIAKLHWDIKNRELIIAYNDHTIQRTNPSTFQLSSIKTKSFDQGTFHKDFFDAIHFSRLWYDKKNFLSAEAIALKDDSAKLILKSDVTHSSKWTIFFEAWKRTGGNVIYDMAEDDHGLLWILTDNGIMVTDTTWSNFSMRQFPEFLKTDFKNQASKMRLTALSKNRIAIFRENELLLYNAQEDYYKLIKITDFKKPISGRTQHAPVTLDTQGRLVVEYEGEMYRLEDDNRLTLLWKIPSKYVVRTIFIDRSNTLWVGTDMGGLYKVNLNKGTFLSKKYKDSFMLDVIENEFKLNNSHLLKEVLSSRNAYTFRYFYTTHGNLVFQCSKNNNQSNFDVFTIQNSKLTPLLHDLTTDGILGKGYGDTMYLLDSNNKLSKWNTSLLRSVKIDSIDLPFSRNSSYDESIRVIDLVIAKDFLWAVTKGKGIHLIENHKVTRSLQLPFTNPINTAQLDSSNKDILWIGTTGEGLYKWNTKTNKQMAHFTVENGLPNNAIHSIIPDSLGYFWMSTNRGITRFNPKTETFTNFFTEDGLYESEFNRHHALMLPDGRIAFGGTNGYSVFHPKDFIEDTVKPKVYITRFAVNNKEADHRTDSTLLPQPITKIERVELDYDQNSLEFQFAALQFNAPEKIKYRYQLVGFDKDWVMLGSDNKIRFSQLPFGEYKLRLNATNTIGQWSPNVRELFVTVRPPFWLTWWAVLFYSIVIGLGIRYYWRAYRKRLIAKQEIEFNLRETKRLKELDETKTRFFSNITHEFRTPLTLILSPLEKHLNDTSLQPKALSILNNNYRHASQLLRLVNQLLDISKLESGQMQVHSTVGDLASFLENCITSFQQKASDKKLNLELSMINIEGNYLFDHDKLQKIILNLLSNALKFTDEGSIRIKAEEAEASWLEIEVTDTGIGIEENQLPKIFDRFYQTDDSSTRTYEGTGIGLSLVKELLTLLGGKILVESKLGEGTTFKIKLPIQKLKEIHHADSATLDTLKLSESEKITGVNNALPVILVVEDNAELREFITESLKANWIVFEAANGLDGWAIIERELPEIVITDLMMPGMNGIELCEKVKQDVRTCHISFIMLTAKAAQESKIEGLKAGAEVYITKPFHLHELELQIRNLLMEQHNLRTHLQKKTLPSINGERKSQQTDPFIKKLDAFISQHLDDSLLNVDRIAEAMAMSRSTLNRKMKIVLNASVNEYIKQYRLQRAANLLAEGIHVNEVAWKVGFESSSYFTQCFKEYYQKTPSEFRAVKFDSKLIEVALKSIVMVGIS